MNARLNTIYIILLLLLLCTCTSRNKDGNKILVKTDLRDTFHFTLPGNDLKSEKIDLPNNTKRLVAFFDSKSYWHMYINKTLEKWIPVINSYGNPEKLDILIFIEIDTVKLSEIDSMLVNGGLQYPVIYDFDNYFRNTIIKSHTLPKYGNTMSFISYIFDEDNNIIQLTNPTIPNFYRDIEKFLKKNH